ncbi:MAG: heat-inducible transcription repressor HrcA [Acidobacteria bacterium]|nr:heat-inducible transcription repressor HrcA [Acidobacteriota bacterium]
MRVEPLEGRKREVLAAVVRAHIATGAPVSSSRLVGRSGLPVSSATVRNVMASLEEEGYLNQPHTSAGRLPTAQAYEFYAREIAARARLRPADQKRINRYLAAEEGDASQLLGRVPHVLSELCHGVGLVFVPPLAATVLGQLRFVRLDDRRILAVVVTRDGRVRDKVVRARERYRTDELDCMSTYLNENFRGWGLEAIHAELERRLAAERSQFLRQAAALCQQTFDLGDEPSTVQMEGMARLVEQLEATDPQALRELLQALEEKERLARLLADCLESPEPPVRIVIGLERLTPAMKDLAFIGAPYGGQTGVVGSLGLLGPTRMDYARAITAVRYVATLFNRLFAEN